MPKLPVSLDRLAVANLVSESEVALCWLSEIARRGTPFSGGILNIEGRNRLDNLIAGLNHAINGVTGTDETAKVRVARILEATNDGDKQEEEPCS